MSDYDHDDDDRRFTEALAGDLARLGDGAPSAPSPLRLRVRLRSRSRRRAVAVAALVTVVVMPFALATRHAPSSMPPPAIAVTTPARFIPSPLPAAVGGDEARTSIASALDALGVAGAIDVSKAADGRISISIVGDHRAALEDIVSCLGTLLAAFDEAHISREARDAHHGQDFCLTLLHLPAS